MKENDGMGIKTILDGANRHKNYFLMAFLAVFVCGYVFFFSSTYWFPAETTKNATAMGTTLTNDDWEFTLLSWDYSKDQDMMEVVLDVRNLSVKTSGEYEITAIERTQGSLETECVVSADDLLVVRIVGMKSNWKEVSLRVGLADSDSTVKMYANKQGVNTVDWLATRTAADYYAVKYEGEIAGYQDAIAEYQERISEDKVAIAEYQERLAELAAGEEYQTQAEIEETESLIGTINGNISTAESEVEALSAEIEECNQKIAILYEMLRDKAE